MNDNATPTTTTPRQFEREACGRCGGTGEYSYCQMYGRKCFQCQGKRTILTKRGAAANEYCRKLRSRRTDELKVGDVIRDSFHGDCVVQELRPSEQDASYIDVVTSRVRFVGVKADEPHLLRLNAAEMARTLAEALDYQDTLTKAGTPRKR